jgi:hypothetical protein
LNFETNEFQYFLNLTENTYLVWILEACKNPDGRAQFVDLRAELPESRVTHVLAPCSKKIIQNLLDSVKTPGDDSSLLTLVMIPSVQERKEKYKEEKWNFLHKVQV